MGWEMKAKESTGRDQQGLPEIGLALLISENKHHRLIPKLTKMFWDLPRIQSWVGKREPRAQIQKSVVGRKVKVMSTC